MNTNLTLVDSNIPVKSSFILLIKEIVHNFFRRPIVVRVCTYLPPFYPFKKYKELALLITKCHQTFKTISPSAIDVKVYGGDKLSTLRKLENSLYSKKKITEKTTISFSLDNSLEAARNIRKHNHSQKIGILNLANRRQPGGIGLAPYGGSQEEFLIRRSNLAWGLDPRFPTEKVHQQLQEIRKKENLLDPFQHHIPYFGAVVSRHVTFIDKDKPDHFDVISAAAPDMRRGSDEYCYLQKFGKNMKAAQLQILQDKIKAIFDAAIAEGIDHLVLGAFGCGCFQNDSEEVAKIFSQLLNSDYKNRFRHIIFAITEQSKLEIFQKIISGSL